MADQPPVQVRCASYVAAVDEYGVFRKAEQLLARVLPMHRVIRGGLPFSAVTLRSSICEAADTCQIDDEDQYHRGEDDQHESFLEVSAAARLSAVEIPAAVLQAWLRRAEEDEDTEEGSEVDTAPTGAAAAQSVDAEGKEEGAPAAGWLVVQPVLEFTSLTHGPIHAVHWAQWEELKTLHKMESARLTEAVAGQSPTPRPSAPPCMLVSVLLLWMHDGCLHRVPPAELAVEAEALRLAAAVADGVESTRSLSITAGSSLSPFTCFMKLEYPPGVACSDFLPVPITAPLLTRQELIELVRSTAHLRRHYKLRVAYRICTDVLPTSTATTTPTRWGLPLRPLESDAAMEGFVRDVLLFGSAAVQVVAVRSDGVTKEESSDRYRTSVSQVGIDAGVASDLQRGEEVDGQREKKLATEQRSVDRSSHAALTRETRSSASLGKVHSYTEEGAAATLPPCRYCEEHLHHLLESRPTSAKDRRQTEEKAPLAVDSDGLHHGVGSAATASQRPPPPPSAGEEGGREAPSPSRAPLITRAQEGGDEGVHLPQASNVDMLSSKKPVGASEKGKAPEEASQQHKLEAPQPRPEASTVLANADRMKLSAAPPAERPVDLCGAGVVQKRASKETSKEVSRDGTPSVTASAPVAPASQRRPTTSSGVAGNAALDPSSMVLVRYEVDPTIVYVSGEVTATVLHHLQDIIFQRCCAHLCDDLDAPRPRFHPANQRARSAAATSSSSTGKEGSGAASRRSPIDARLPTVAARKGEFILPLYQYTFTKVEEDTLERCIAEVMAVYQGLEQLPASEAEKWAWGTDRTRSSHP